MTSACGQSKTACLRSCANTSGCGCFLAGITLLEQAEGRSASMTQPQQVLTEVARYSELLRRPTIATALSSERKQLCDNLERILSNITSECDRRNSALLMGLSQGGATVGRITTEVLSLVVGHTGAQRVALAEIRARSL